LASDDQPTQQGAKTTEALRDGLGSQRQELDLEITRRAASWNAVHQAQKAEASEPMQVELRRTRAGTSSRILEHVAPQSLVAILRRTSG
jgi:hypothetical protein